MDIKSKFLAATAFALSGTALTSVLSATVLTVALSGVAAEKAEAFDFGQVAGVLENAASGAMKDRGVQRYVEDRLHRKYGRGAGEFGGAMFNAYANSIDTCRNTSSMRRDFKVDNRTGQVYRDNTYGRSDETCRNKNYGSLLGSGVSSGSFSSNPTGYGR